jgi:cyclohexa-1,5-dienecarbonyl-CoA hydratase
MTPVTVSVTPDRTRAHLVFAHPTGNIVTLEIVRQLRAALEDLAGVQPLRLVTLEGAGADFSFGASIPEHTPEAIGEVLPEMHELIRDLLAVPAPTAAVVRGRCLGGGFELALACDFIFAANTAVFGLPEIALGVFPPAGSVLLPARVGAARAASVVLSGDSRPAAWWQRAGLIEGVAPERELGAAVDDWYTRTLAPRSAAALREAVRVVRLPLVRLAQGDLAEAERLYLNDLMSSHDAVEGVRAFLDKRAPRWKDH